ncbi:MAG: GNAT family N-acetyltransferase [Cytophagales bacterium]|nr:GNAT family N-acetyltransferase [Cytophagales bacterium]
MELEITELTSQQINAYKELILEGLAVDADCFRITPEDEVSAPFPTTGKVDSFTLGAYDKTKLIGVASFKRDGEDRMKLRHKGILFKIYVDAEYRQRGIAKRLIQEVISRARKIDDLEQINLTVIPTNKHAKKLYENFGFETYASEQKAIKWEGKYFNEDQMKLLLNSETFL